MSEIGLLELTLAHNRWGFRAAWQSSQPAALPHQAARGNCGRAIMVQVHSCRAAGSGTSLLRGKQASLIARPLAVSSQRTQRYGASCLYTPNIIALCHGEYAEMIQPFIFLYASSQASLRCNRESERALMCANALAFSRQWGCQEQQSSIRISGNMILLEQCIVLHRNHGVP